MKPLIFIIYMLAALCGQQSSFANAINFFLTMKYNMLNSCNRFFDQEINFNRWEAEEIFVDEQIQRKQTVRKFEEMHEKVTVNGAIAPVHQNATLFWSMGMFNAVRYLHAYRTAQFIRANLHESKQKMTEDELCRNRNNAEELSGICVRAFGNTFFQEKFWVSNVSKRSPYCENREVVVLKDGKSSTFTRNVLACPAISTDRRGRPTSLFTVYISANDKRSLGHLTYFVFSDDAHEPAPQPQPPGEQYEESEDKVCQTNGRRAAGRGSVIRPSYVHDKGLSDLGNVISAAYSKKGNTSNVTTGTVVTHDPASYEQKLKRTMDEAFMGTSNDAVASVTSTITTVVEENNVKPSALKQSGLLNSLEQTFRTSVQTKRGGQSDENDAAFSAPHQLDKHTCNTSPRNAVNENICSRAECPRNPSVHNSPPRPLRSQSQESSNLGKTSSPSKSRHHYIPRPSASFVVPSPQSVHRDKPNYASSPKPPHHRTPADNSTPSSSFRDGKLNSSTPYKPSHHYMRNSSTPLPAHSTSSLRNSSTHQSHHHQHHRHDSSASSPSSTNVEPNSSAPSKPPHYYTPTSPAPLPVPSPMPLRNSPTPKSHHHHHHHHNHNSSAASHQHTPNSSASSLSLLEGKPNCSAPFKLPHHYTPTSPTPLPVHLLSPFRNSSTPSKSRHHHHNNHYSHASSHHNTSNSPTPAPSTLHGKPDKSHHRGKHGSTETRAPAKAPPAPPLPPKNFKLRPTTCKFCDESHGPTDKCSSSFLREQYSQHPSAGSSPFLPSTKSNHTSDPTLPISPEHFKLRPAPCPECSQSHVLSVACPSDAPPSSPVAPSTPPKTSANLISSNQNNFLSSTQTFFQSNPKIATATFAPIPSSNTAQKPYIVSGDPPPGNNLPHPDRVKNQPNHVPPSTEPDEVIEDFKSELFRGRKPPLPSPSSATEASRYRTTTLPLSSPLTYASPSIPLSSPVLHDVAKPPQSERSDHLETQLSLNAWNNGVSDEQSTKNKEVHHSPQSSFDFPQRIAPSTSTHNICTSYSNSSRTSHSLSRVGTSKKSFQDKTPPHSEESSSRHQKGSHSQEHRDSQSREHHHHRPPPPLHHRHNSHPHHRHNNHNNPAPSPPPPVYSSTSKPGEVPVVASPARPLYVVTLLMNKNRAARGQNGKSTRPVTNEKAD